LDINRDDLPDDMDIDEDGNVTVKAVPDDDDPGPGAGDGDGSADDDGHTGAGDDPGAGHDGEGDQGTGEDDDTQDKDDDPATLQQTVLELRREIDELKKGTTPPATTKTETDDQGSGTPSQDQPPSTPSTPYAEARSQKVEYEDKSHPFHNKTLGEIFDLNPQEAWAISPYHTNILQQGKMMEEREAERQEQERQAEIDRQTQQELADFHAEFSQSKFSTPYNTLTDVQKAEVTKESDAVMKWMMDNKKFGITITEAHFLMNRGKAAADAARKVVDDASRGRVHTISSSRDTSVDADGADMSKWSEEKMLEYIEGLEEEKLMKFLSSAPKSVQKAFPDMPWA
jgi:hypothetical protein